MKPARKIPSIVFTDGFLLCQPVTKLMMICKIIIPQEIAVRENALLA